MRYRQRSDDTHQQSKVKGMARDQYWPSTLMGLGIFIGLVSFFTVVFRTLVEPMDLFRLFLGLCFVGNLLPYRRSGLRLGMERLEWFLFNLLAVGPLGISLLLWLNLLVHGPVTATDHVVAGSEITRTFVTYRFQDAHLEEFPLARKFFRDPGDAVGRVMHYEEATGLFGLRVVVEREIAPRNRSTRSS